MGGHERGPERMRALRTFVVDDAYLGWQATTRERPGLAFAIPARQVSAESFLVTGAIEQGGGFSMQACVSGGTTSRRQRDGALVGMRGGRNACVRCARNGIAHDEQGGASAEVGC